MKWNSLLRDDGDALGESEVEAPQRLRVVAGKKLRDQVLVVVTVALQESNQEVMIPTSG